MSYLKRMIAIIAISLLGFGAIASAGASFSIGTGNFYMSVGDYDYLPYAATYGGYTPQIDFNSTMGQYGSWVSVDTFGRAWRPYVSQDWRPYTQGHWVYTQYGPTWSAYEPWGWAAYHYGNWIWTPNYGWVWIPGYTWTPANVNWSQGYGTVGWIPAPPQGYDYSRGYLSFRGGDNQFNVQADFTDDGYGNGYGGGYSNGPYMDPRYNDLYYNPGYQRIVPNLWIFININNFGRDDYSNCYLGPQYVQQVFVNRAVRVSSRPLPRVFVEKETRKTIRELPVQVKEIKADQKTIKVVVPEGEQDVVRAHANKVVTQVIAPAFVEKNMTFKGENAKGQPALSRAFKQDDRKPQVEKVDSDTIIKRAKQDQQNDEQERNKNQQQALNEIDRATKQGNNHQNQDHGNANVTNNPSNPSNPSKNVEQPKNGNRDQQFERGHNNNTNPNNNPKYIDETHQNQNQNQNNNQNNNDQKHPNLIPPPKKPDTNEQGQVEKGSQTHQNDPKGTNHGSQQMPNVHQQDQSDHGQQVTDQEKSQKETQTQQQDKNKDPKKKDKNKEHPNNQDNTPPQRDRQ